MSIKILKDNSITEELINVLDWYKDIEKIINEHNISPYRIYLNNQPIKYIYTSIDLVNSLNNYENEIELLCRSTIKYQMLNMNCPIYLLSYTGIGIGIYFLGFSNDKINYVKHVKLENVINKVYVLNNSIKTREKILLEVPNNSNLILFGNETNLEIKNIEHIKDISYLDKLDYSHIIRDKTIYFKNLKYNLDLKYFKSGLEHIILGEKCKTEVLIISDIKSITILNNLGIIEYWYGMNTNGEKITIRSIKDRIIINRKEYSVKNSRSEEFNFEYIE